MKLIYGEKFSEAEKRKNLAYVYLNTLQAMKALAEQAILFNLEDKVEAKESLKAIRRTEDTEEINIEIGNHIKELWQDPGIKAVWDRRSEFQVFNL